MYKLSLVVLLKIFLRSFKFMWRMNICSTQVSCGSCGITFKNISESLIKKLLVNACMRKLTHIRRANNLPAWLCVVHKFSVFRLRLFQRVYWKSSWSRHIWESLLIFKEAVNLLEWSCVEHKCPVSNVVKHLRIFQRVYWKRSRSRHIWESLLIFKRQSTCWCYHLKCPVTCVVNISEFIDKVVSQDIFEDLTHV